MRTFTHQLLLISVVFSLFFIVNCKGKIQAERQEKTESGKVKSSEKNSTKKVNPTDHTPDQTVDKKDASKEWNADGTTGSTHASTVSNDQNNGIPNTDISRASVKNLCSDSNFDLITYLITQAKRIEKDSIPYDAAKGNDCSGIFHRYLNTVKGHCPTSLYPTMQSARSTRDLGKWYYDRGNLTIIKDPIAQADLIKPGAVMFYGYGNRYKLYDRSTMTIDSLTVRGKGINHVAVVLSVSEKDGVIESYEIFHGRNPRHPAGITSCIRYSNRRPDFPPYGNWNEPWLAVADILTQP